jgi:hypothetical protein
MNFSGTSVTCWLLPRTDYDIKPRYMIWYSFKLTLKNIIPISILVQYYIQTRFLLTYIQCLVRTFCWEKKSMVKFLLFFCGPLLLSSAIFWRLDLSKEHFSLSEFSNLWSWLSVDSHHSTKIFNFSRFVLVKNISFLSRALRMGSIYIDSCGILVVFLDCHFRLVIISCQPDWLHAYCSHYRHMNMFVNSNATWDLPEDHVRDFTGQWKLRARCPGEWWPQTPTLPPASCTIESAM